MIRNYTSEASAVSSIARISQMLVDHGATDIQHTYADKKLVGITFLMPAPGLGDRKVPVRLPARTHQIEVMLRKQLRRPTPASFKRISEQAQRTAWKFLAEWVQIQLDLVTLEQAEFMEMFLPFVYIPEVDCTYYERLKAAGTLPMLSEKAAPRDQGRAT